MSSECVPWRLLLPRRTDPQAILCDLLEYRVRWIEQGRCGECDAPYPDGGAWCWSGTNAPARCELRHASGPDIGALYPSELAILLPWLDEQKANRGVKDFQVGSLAASAARSTAAAPARRSRWRYALVATLGFVLGVGATVLALALNGVTFG